MTESKASIQLNSSSAKRDSQVADSRRRESRKCLCLTMFENQDRAEKMLDEFVPLGG